jgi:hypothetical protein
VLVRRAKILAIKHVLYRLLDGKVETPPPATAPQTLQLVQEPQANVLRYDALRDLERRLRHAS